MDKTLFSYTRQFFSGTLLSRLSGFFRDVSMAYAFGDIKEIAALILAYRLCMLLRRILGEGSMQSAFIPGYQTIREKDPALALEFFKQIIFKWLLGVGTLCVLLASVFFYLKPVFNENWQPVVDLSIRLLPCLLFIIGYTLFQAFLQCHGRYFLSSLAPSLSNLLWGIGCIISKNQEPSRAMQTVSIYICIGLFLQWIVLFPEVKKLIPSHFYKLKISKLSSEIYGFNFFKAVSLAAIGVSATQINSALDGVFAKFADPKGPIHLWFSIRIQQLPLALLSIGLISASTPRLCQLMALNQKDEAGHLCSSVASKLSILMMFLTCMIICLGDQIIRLLFEHGMFSEAATTQTLYCLIAYMVGLAPTSLSTVYASFFYALKEYKKPSIASIYALIANLVLNAVMIFVFHFGAWSVAATTSACSFLNAYLLKRSLKSENLVAPFSKKQVLMPSMTAIFSALILTVLKMIMPTMKPILSIPLLGLMYTGLYVAVCKLLAFHEPLELFTQFFKKRSIERV